MTLIVIISFILIFFLIYSIIPTIYNKYFNKKAVRKTLKQNEIMLTFDDGPDERYINELLDVLLENDIQATFFVVARNAEKNANIIKRIKKENHCIGLHSLEHKNGLFFTPSYTKKDFVQSLLFMQELGCNINYYRPPWGHTNIFTNYYLKKYNLKMIFWDVMAEDWQEKATINTIATKIMARTKNNSIICLHDAGENSGGAKGAPLKTIDALRQVLPLLKQKGYKFVTPERIFNEETKK